MTFCKPKRKISERKYSGFSERHVYTVQHEKTAYRGKRLIEVSHFFLLFARLKKKVQPPLRCYRQKITDHRCHTNLSPEI